MTGWSEKPIGAADDEGEANAQDLKIKLAEVKFQLQRKDLPDADRKQLMQQAVNAISEHSMTHVYQHFCDTMGWQVDSAALDRMKEANTAKLGEFDQQIEAAEAKEGDEEIRDAMLRKADYLCNIGSQQDAAEAYEAAIKKSPSPATKLTVAFCKARLAMLLGDWAEVKRLLEEAREVCDKGGDWEKKNRLTVRRHAASRRAAAPCTLSWSLDNRLGSDHRVRWKPRRSSCKVPAALSTVYKPRHMLPCNVKPGNNTVCSPGQRHCLCTAVHTLSKCFTSHATLVLLSRRSCGRRFMRACTRSRSASLAAPPPSSSTLWPRSPPPSCSPTSAASSTLWLPQSSRCHGLSSRRRRVPTELGRLRQAWTVCHGKDASDVLYGGPTQAHQQLAVPHTYKALGWSCWQGPQSFSFFLCFFQAHHRFACVERRSSCRWWRRPRC